MSMCFVLEVDRMLVDSRFSVDYHERIIGNGSMRIFLSVLARIAVIFLGIAIFVWLVYRESKASP